jgi:hypothetical protein
MLRQPTWFRVHLAAVGSSGERAAAEVRDMQEELKLRPHLRNPQARWDKETERALVWVDVQDFNADSAGKQMAEELFEIATAVITRYERLRVDILDVQPAPPSTAAWPR